MCWYEQFDEYVTKINFKRRKYDPCVYFQETNNNGMIYLLLCIDDMLLADDNLEELKDIELILGKEFDMKNFQV